jgi:hypothetical protein
MQRNGQNPIKSSGVFEKAHPSAGANPAPRSSGGGVHCPACKTEVPPKPGFRLSALKCPKCGASMAKK